MMDDMFQGSMVDVDSGRVLWAQAGFQFLAVSVVDGTVLAELPELQLTRLVYRFEESTSETVLLPWHNICRNWGEVTMPYQVAVLLVRGETVQTRAKPRRRGDNPYVGDCRTLSGFRACWQSFVFES